MRKVLAALRDSFTLVNCSDTPLRWEIHRYYPELSTYNADTLRFEVVGKRRGLLAPGASEKLQVSLLATSACEFAQLVGIQYFEDVPGSEPRAAYFFLASSMKPPKDLEELEVDSALLPSLDHVRAFLFEVTRSHFERSVLVWAEVRRFTRWPTFCPRKQTPPTWL